MHIEQSRKNDQRFGQHGKQPQHQNVEHARREESRMERIRKNDNHGFIARLIKRNVIKGISIA